MRTYTIPIAALLATALFAQTAEENRTLRITSAPTARDFQEVATVIRSLAEIRTLNADFDQRAITLQATPQQAALADWLARELDGTPQAPHQFRLAADDVVRIFYVRNAADLQGFQEIATVARAMAEIRRLFTCNRLNAVVARGTPAQLALAEWLLGELDRPLQEPAPKGARAYEVPDLGPETIVRVYRLPRTATVQDFQEAAVTVRAIGEIRRVFTYNAPRALVLRGTASEMALADWLVPQLDSAAKPAEVFETREYRMQGTGIENAVRLFRLANAPTPQRLQEIATEVRGAEQIRRVFTCNTPRLIVMRGTQDQMEAATRMVSARDRR